MFSNSENLTRFIEERSTITSHPGLAGNTSGDENNLGTLKCRLQSLRARVITSDFALGVDMRNIGGNTCRC